MQFEGITLLAIIGELREHLIGSTFQKIHQPTADLLILQTYKNAKNKLLIATGSDARMHLTKQSYSNPANPSPFCMLLRKYLMGAVIHEINQVGVERIVDLVIVHREGQFTLRCELLGNQSNILLLKSTKILGAIHLKIGSREFLPGLEYVPPKPQDKINPLNIDDEKIIESLDNLGDLKLAQSLSQVLEGISPKSAKEILLRAKIDATRSGFSLDRNECAILMDSIRIFFKLLQTGTLNPNVYWDDEVPTNATPIPYLIHADFRATETASFSEALDKIHEGMHQEPIEIVRTKLSKQLKSKLKRAERSLKQTRQDMEKAELFGRHKDLGDLIMGNLQSITKGQNEVALTDYEGNPVKISIDPRLTPVENAQAKYKKYKKLKRGVEKIGERELMLQQELEYFSELEFNLGQAESLEDLQELESELQLGSTSKSKSRKGKTAAAISGPRKYIIDGYTLLIGRNGRQNDALIRQANKDDLWFHAKDKPGAHALLATNREQNIPSQVLEAAAQISAYFSRGRDENKVTVTYTRVKNLRKPKGAKPGLVIVTREEGTLTVSPREGT